MASTYSTNLALELIGTGDQAGTWGNTTNTNLGTLIEQAISGYVTQAVSTGNDTTITIPNGATGVARNMYIELTGTGGTDTNLIVPANKKLYFIYNNTSSGQVTVKVSGQTGVSIANGEKIILVSNGTDVVAATSYLISPAASATITSLSATSLTVSSNAYLNSSASDLSGIAAAALFVKTDSVVTPYPALFKQTLNDVTAVFWNNRTTGDNAFLAFGTETSYTARGSITYNRGAGLVAYNTSSDRRAKTIYGPVTNSGQIIDSLNVYQGKMNWGTEIYPMMIADEMQPIVPYSVTGQPNATNPDGSPKYQQVDYGSLVPLLLAEIQSLRQRVAALEASP